jgi:bifunctional non-homologous end joining protein LigD
MGSLTACRRILSACKPTIYTRNGHDWSRQLAPMAAAVAALNVRTVVLDGEPVVLDNASRSDFGVATVLQQPQDVQRQKSSM